MVLQNSAEDFLKVVRSLRYSLSSSPDGPRLPFVFNAALLIADATVFSGIEG